MSNIYIQEPPTEGKVLLVTTAGEFDIELWSKEAPKACRNFVQLCMEGYYNNTVFHRVEPGFIVQGGDPTGTGNGGESIYGSPFKDEFHTRLRFVRRGLVAMANAGPNDNGSQFFFTLEATPELQNKHTIFGKIAGDTVYNISRFAEGEIGKDGRPEFPHKIIKADILNNPFDDIIPRVAIENEILKDDLKKKKGTKNFKLLSFGDEAEEDEEEFVTATKKMGNIGNSAHDIARDPTLSSAIEDSKIEREVEIKKIREKLKKTSKTKEEVEKEENDIVDESKEKQQKDKTRSEIKAEIRKLKRELQGKDTNDAGLETNSGDEQEHKKLKGSEILQQYIKDKERFVEEKKKLPKKGTSRESQTLALLERFSKKVKDATAKAEESLETEKPIEVTEKNKSTDNDDEDNDESWLIHKLLFDDQEDAVMAKDASTKDDHWYDLTDPRNAHNKRRREEKPPKKIK